MDGAHRVLLCGRVLVTWDSPNSGCALGKAMLLGRHLTRKSPGRCLAMYIACRPLCSADLAVFEWARATGEIALTIGGV